MDHPRDMEAHGPFEARYLAFLETITQLAPHIRVNFPAKAMVNRNRFFARVEADFQRKDAVQVPGVRHWFRST